MELIKYVGLPYVVGETDCWQLMRTFHREQLNNELPEYFYDVSNYMKIIESKVGEASKEALKGWTKVTTSPQLGDIFIFVLGGFPTHCGVYLGNNNFLHTLKGTNSSIEELSDMWKKRLIGTWRYDGR